MKPSPRRYLALFLGLFVLLIGATAGIAYLADPLGIYHWRNASRSLSNRTGILNLLYLHKAHAVRTERPNVLLLGNSRVLFGLDPAHPGLPERTYNLGLGGAKVYECWRYLQQSGATHLPQTVILGLDAKMFNEDGTRSPEFSEERLDVAPDGTPRRFAAALSDVPATLASVSALYYTAKMLHPFHPPLRYDRGFPSNSLLLVHHMDLAANVFSENREWLAPYTQHYRDDRGKTPELDAYRAIVAYCAQNHVRLVVFLHPLHAAMTDLMTADWDGYRQWLRTVVGTLDAAPGLQWECWDFTGYNTLSTEPFPQPGETVSRMRFYWEGSHYRQNVGDLVLSRILGTGGDSAFGQRVTPATVEADLDRLEREKNDWHRRGQAVPIALP